MQVDTGILSGQFLGGSMWAAYVASEAPPRCYAGEAAAIPSGEVMITANAGLAADRAPANAKFGFFLPSYCSSNLT